MKRRFLPAVSIGILTTFCLGITVIPAKAQATASPAQAAAAPTFEICNNLGSKSLCLNRNGGGTGGGTAIIGYSAGDPNNGFLLVQLNNLCNHGFVSADMQCPFSPGGGLNRTYDGSPIVEIQAYDLQNPLCVADSGVGSGSSALGACPDVNGKGGAAGTWFVTKQLTNNQNPFVIVNRYWTDLPPGQGGGGGTRARFMCITIKSTPVFLNHSPASAGTCVFNEI
jgi:hypothetical protein